MDRGANISSNIPCLICNTLVVQTDNHQSLSSSLHSSNLGEDKKRIILFLLRDLLEIPKPFVTLDDYDDDKSKEDNGQCSKNTCSWRHVVTCEHCEESIKQASLIYCEIRQLAHRFRDIQKKIVESLKKCSAADNDDDDPGVLELNVVKYYRKLVNDCDYNGFRFPFTIQDDNDDEEGNGNEDDMNFTSENESYEEVVVKEEVEEEDNIDKGYQKILLILPEEVKDGDGDEGCQTNSEEDDHEPVSQTDSDSQSDEELNEKGDSDNRSSELSAEAEEDDDDEYQVILKDPLEADDDQRANTEEDDTGSCSNSKGDVDLPPTKKLSAFRCKKCLEHFPTKRERLEHSNKFHFKEQRGKFLCPLKGCTKTYTYARTFPRHFTVHHEKPPFICKECEQEFSNLDQVRIHHKQTHPSKAGPLPPGPRSRIRRPPQSSPKPPGRPRKIPGQDQHPKKFNGRWCNPDNPFPCPFCPFRLKRFRNLTIHLKNYHPSKPISLPDLKKINPKRCNPDNQFPCPLCTYRLKDYISLKLHIKRYHPGNPTILTELRLKYFPPTPPTLEPSLPEVRKSTRHPSRGGLPPLFELEYPHIICNPNSSGKYPCPWSTDPTTPCSKIYPKKTPLHRHIKIKHLNLTLFNCTWSGCGKSFNTRGNYLEHYDEHRGTPKYKCEDCGLTFYRRNPFLRHKQKMHLGVKFICELCGRDFTCQEYLSLHRSLKHNEKSTKEKNKKDEDSGPGIICDLCGQILKTQETLKVHLQVKHEKVPGKYCCHLCDNRYRSRTHLNRHLWDVHKFKVEGFQPRKKVARKDKFQCPVKGCRMLFLKKENLEKHGIEIHGEDGRKLGPWNCKFCGKNFFQKTKWQHCERTHENKESRPEKCEICGKGFPTKQHLRFHQRNTHKLELEDHRGWRKGRKFERK